MSAAKYNAIWVQEAFEGDITEWLKSANVGLVMRQAAYLASYGNGKNILCMLVHDGTMYIEQHLDAAGRFRGKFKLGGGKDKIVVCDGAPLVPLKTSWVQGDWADDGSLKFQIFSCDEHMTPVSEALRYVSEDGKLITKATCFLKDGSKANLTITHRRTDIPPLTAEYCSTWCPVLIFGDVPSPSNPKVNSALSDSLFKFFSSSAELMDNLEYVWKQRQAIGDEKAVSLKEISGTEFVISVIAADGKESMLGYKIDKAAGTATMTSVGPDGKDAGSLFYKTLEDPLRLECYGIWPNGSRVTTIAASSIEDELSRAVKGKHCALGGD